VLRWPSRNRNRAQSRRFHDAMVGVYKRVSERRAPAIGRLRFSR